MKIIFDLIVTKMNKDIPKGFHFGHNKFNYICMNIFLNWIARLWTFVSQHSLHSAHTDMSVSANDKLASPAAFNIALANPINRSTH